MSAKDEYSFEIISQIRQKERRRALSKLPMDFYEKFAQRLAKMKELFQEENKKDPTSLKSMMFADEIRKTKLIFEEIKRRRMRKIFLLALGKISEEGEAPSELLPLEKKLFDDIILALKTNRKAIEAIFGSEGYADEEETSMDQLEIRTEEMIVMEPRAENIEPRPGEGTSPTEPGSEGDLAMVRVLGDIGSFMSPDQRSYNLRKEDILELPASIAKILVEHKKAELYSA